MHTIISIQNSKRRLVLYLATSPVAKRVFFNNCELWLVTWSL